MTIQQLGGRARSFLGHQVRISTDAAYTKARIQSIEGSKLLQAVQGGSIAVVAGFQGIDPDAASPRWAVAARIRRPWRSPPPSKPTSAKFIRMWTESTRPIRTSALRARKIDRISYEEMLELASLGAKVLQIRSRG